MSDREERIQQYLRRFDRPHVAEYGLFGLCRCGRSKSDEIHLPLTLERRSMSIMERAKLDATIQRHEDVLLEEETR